MNTGRTYGWIYTRVNEHQKFLPDHPGFVVAYMLCEQYIGELDDDINCEKIALVSANAPMDGKSSMYCKDHANERLPGFREDN